MTFASSSERPEWPEVSSSKLPSTSYTCLSWDSFECAPHPTSFVRVHSQQRCRCLRPPSAPGRLVPSPWFRTTSTVYSALEFPGLLHHGTGRGSPRFRTMLPLAALPSEEDRLASGQSQHFPAAPFTPPEEVPSTAAVPHRCGRCLLVVVPALPDEQVHHSTPTLDLEALLHC